MKVVRCEHWETHQGPYRAKTWDELIDRFPWVIAHNDKNHPPAWRDNITTIDNNILYDLSNAEIPDYEYQCGFLNVEQAKRWFTLDERLDCMNHGYFFYWFEISDDKVGIGEHQIVFKRKEAKLLGKVEELCCEPGEFDVRKTETRMDAEVLE